MTPRRCFASEAGRTERVPAGHGDPLPVELSIATDAEHFDQILALQRRFHHSTLAAEVQTSEGFVFAEHTPALLRAMAAELPQAIALEGTRVVGYCLAMSPGMREAIPSLRPMFDQFDRLTFRGRRVAEWRHFVGGQVCVDSDWRGQGLIGRLYRHVCRSVPPGHELCVTEIATRNGVSLRAHLRIGFEAVGEYRDANETWVVVALPCERVPGD